MQLNLLHVFRNTPLGRETLMQAADFSRKTHSRLNVYLPEFDRVLLHFGPNAVEIRLDASYLYLQETARHNLQKISKEAHVRVHEVKAETMTASNLPRLPTNFDVISLPRIMVERKGPISIGSGVRKLVKSATASALIAPGRFHDWREVLVLFGGSQYSAVALQWGLAVSRESGLPLRLLTASDKQTSRAMCEDALRQYNLPADVFQNWIFVESGSAVSILDKIPRDAMLMMGAYGHSGIRARLFGSTTELIQKNTANLIMLIGENCPAPQG